MAAAPAPRRRSFAGAFAVLLLACACTDPEPPRTVVVLWQEGVPPEAMFDAPNGRRAAQPTLAALDGLVRHDGYVPSSDRSETRLATLLAETGAVPTPAGPLDWGAREVPEGLLAGELRAAGWRRLAAVSRIELACLAPQFDRLAAPPAEAAPSATPHDLALRALEPAIDVALASDDSLFLLVATDVLARRDPPAPESLAPHLAARLAPLAQDGTEDDAEFAGMRERLALEPADAAEALRERFQRRRGGAEWIALQEAEADARLVRADRWLAELLAKLDEHERREGFALLVVGGTARDPWDAALAAETGAGARAPLFALGLELPRGVVQEAELRDALRRLVAGGDPPAAVANGGDELAIERVVARAGETDLALWLTHPRNPDAPAERWVVDVRGVRPAPEVEPDDARTDAAASAGEADPIGDSEFDPVDVARGLPPTARPERFAATNGLDAAVRLELRTTEGAGLAGEGEIGRRLDARLDAGGAARWRASRRRPALLATWSGEEVRADRCAVGALPLLATDLPLVVRADETPWPEDAPPPALDLVGEGPWLRATVGAAREGDAELLVEAWPPRIAPRADWLDAGDGVTLTEHALRPGAWIARGPAPLELRVQRRSGGEIAFHALLAGERIGPARTRLLGRRAVEEGAVTTLLSAGAWNESERYGAAPPELPLALRLLGAPPRDPVRLPPPAVREHLSRAARIR